MQFRRIDAKATQRVGRGQKFPAERQHFSAPMHHLRLSTRQAAKILRSTEIDRLVTARLAAISNGAKGQAAFRRTRKQER